MSESPADSSHLCVIPVRFAEEAAPEAASGRQKAKRTRECRICLEGEDEGRVIAPCKCTGSVKYTHVRCLAEWIKRKVESNARKRASCEICEAEFSYRLSSVRIFDCEELSRNYQLHRSSIRCFTATYAAFVLLFLAAVGVLAAAQRNAADGRLKAALVPNSTTSAIYVTLLVVYFIVLVVVAILFVSEYVVRQELAVSEVTAYKEPSPFLKNYKIYFKKGTETHT